MTGGVSVASGLRNATSAKNILAWDETPKRRSPHSGGSSASTSPTPVASAALLNIGEYTRYTPPNAVSATSSQDELSGGGAWAGSPSLKPERPQLRKTASLSPTFSPSTPPFGTDDQSPGGPSSPSSFYGRGRTSTGSRFPAERSSPNCF
jgi:hypothetical protein